MRNLDKALPAACPLAASIVQIQQGECKRGSCLQEPGPLLWEELCVLSLRNLLLSMQNITTHSKWHLPDLKCIQIRPQQDKAPEWQPLPPRTKLTITTQTRDAKSILVLHSSFKPLWLSSGTAQPQTSCSVAFSPLKLFGVSAEHSLALCRRSKRADCLSQ